jgi:hypothetical protein
MNRMIKSSITTGALAAAVLLSQQAQALPLGPDSTVAVDPQPLPGTLVIGSALDMPWSIGGFSGEVSTWVYAADPLYLLGGLTFVYEIEVLAGPAGQALTDFGLTDWAGFGAWAAQAAPGEPALAAKRDGGDNITFQFEVSAANKFVLGETSALLILSSDATDFKDSLFGVISGTTDNGNTLAPVATVPDGSVSLACLGIGLLALQGFRRLVPA